jgi:hypothetical protein
MCPKPDESILKPITTEKVERRKATIEKKAKAQQSDLLQESATMSGDVEVDDGVVALLVSVWAGRGEEVWSSEKA